MAGNAAKKKTDLKTVRTMVRRLNNKDKLVLLEDLQQGVWSKEFKATVAELRRAFAKQPISS